MIRKHSTYNPATKILTAKTHQHIYNVDANLGYLIFEKLYMNPQRICQISDDTGRSMTNLEMYERSLKFANHFKTKLHLKQYDVFGLITSTTENVTPIMFGCLILGVAVNHLSVLMSVEEVVEIWSNTRPKVIFIEDKMMDIVLAAVDKMKLDAKIYTMKERRNGYKYADDILNEDYDVDSFDFPELPNISSTTAFIHCSSGTTGPTKSICKSHKHIISQSLVFWDRLLDGKEVYLNIDKPFWSVHQSLLMICTLFDIPIVIQSHCPDANAFMDVVDRHKVTTVYISMNLLANLIENPKARKLESIRIVVLGGSTFNEKLLKDVKKIFPHGKFMINYGSIECGCISNSIGSEAVLGQSSGYLNYNVQLKIIDENGNPVGPNQAGEIYMKCPGITPKYLNNPEATAELYDKDGFQKSGDYCYFDDLGQIHYLERIKFLIKSMNEYRVTPIEVERHINEIDGVAESRVVGVFDEKLRYELIWAFVVRKEGRTDVTEQKIKDHLKKKVIKEKRITGGVHFIDKIPRNCNGKVLCRVMQEMAKELSCKTQNGSK